MIELVLSGVVVACAIVLLLVAKRLARDPDIVWELVVIAGGLGILIWLPSWLRSLLIGGVAVAVVFEHGWRYVAAMSLLVIPIAIWLPGGVSVVLFALLAMLGISELRASRRHLVRIARARELVVNQPVEHEVEHTGAAHATVPTVDPVFGGPCALWHVTGAGRRQSEAMIELRGAAGSALVEMSYAQLQLGGIPKRITGDEAARAAQLLRIELVDGALSLHVLPEGTECYVVGRPVWEVATCGLYRGGNILPKFGSLLHDPALFADRSETQLRNDHTWGIVAWSAWGTICAVIAVLQAGGWT